MPHGVRTYLLVDKTTNNAVIIDPTTEDKELYYSFFAKNKQITLTHVLDTHTHADHISLAKELKKKYSKISYAINVNAPTQSKDIALHDGEIIQFGNSSIISLYTPGHTNDSMTFVATSNNKKYLFTGDIILAKGTGRTDFQEGSSIKSYEAIMRLTKFPDETIICPAHDYDDKLETTMGHVQRYNSRVILALHSRDAFVDALNKHKPPLPELFIVSITENSK